MEYAGFSVLWWLVVFMSPFALERSAVGESGLVDTSLRFGTPPQWSTAEHEFSPDTNFSSLLLCCVAVVCTV